MKDDSKKRQKFIELANARVNRALKELQLIGNLSNKRSYSYTEKDTKQILRALEGELDKLREKLKSGSDRGSNAFRLEE
jgi:predicted phage tail protein